MTEYTAGDERAALATATGASPLRRWCRLLQGKLRRQLTLPVLIGLIQLGIALLEVIDGQAPPAILLWLLAALVVGFGFGRATRVAWDSDASQLVLVGGQVVLTLAWLLAQVSSRTLLPYALNGLNSAGVIVLLVAGGLVVGHALGLLGQIHGALRRQDD